MMGLPDGLLMWGVGILVVLSLLSAAVGGGSDRRKNRRKRHRSAGARFPRKVLPGRLLRMIDGDGLLVDVDGFGNTSVRLAYVDAPEHDQPWGEESKAALERLSHGKELRFRLLYRDRYARTVAIVFADDAVVNEQMVLAGHAWALCARAAAPSL